MLSARLVSRVIRSQSSRASFAALGAARGSVSPRIIPNEVSSFPEVHTPLCGISPPKNRSFAASASTDAAPALSEVVEEELNYERSTEGTNEDLPSPPQGWTMTESAGGSVINLARQFEGEQILITTDINKGDHSPLLANPPLGYDNAGEVGEPNPQDQPEEMEDMSQEYMIDFRVEISKRGDKLRFRFSLLGLYDAAVLKDLYLQVIPSWIEGLFDGDNLEITHVGHGLKQSGEFDGPDYSTLDPSLQQGFVDYLAERGIDAALGEFLMAAHDAKEQQEYVHWLSRVNSFLTK